MPLSIKTKNQGEFIQMKFTMKVALVISLFCSTAIVALADGQMGSGTKACQTNCLVGGQPTIGDVDTKTAKDETNDLPNIFEFLKDFVSEIFG
jgi:hypothetical protein